jgi:hypothetical protein
VILRAEYGRLRLDRGAPHRAAVSAFVVRSSRLARERIGEQIAAGDRSALGPGEEPLEMADVAKHIVQTLAGQGRFGWLASVPLAMVLAGCGPEGAGTVDVGNPQAVGSKLGGGETPNKPLTKKQAKGLETEAEAAKKNPKLY